MMSEDFWLLRRICGWFRRNPDREAKGWKGLKAVQEEYPGAFSEKMEAPNHNYS